MYIYSTFLYSFHPLGISKAGGVEVAIAMIVSTLHQTPSHVGSTFHLTFNEMESSAYQVKKKNSEKYFGQKATIFLVTS